MPVLVNGYVLRAFSVFYLHLLLGVGLTIVVTYAGLLDLGYIAFFAVGAYTYALLDRYVGLPFFLAVPIGMAIASAFGLILGFPTLRVRGDYLALVTMGFGEIVRVLLVNIWGPHGIAGIRPPLDAKFLGSIGNLYLVFYLVSFVPVPCALWFLSRIDRSKVAQTWFAIRDDETAAKSCGMNTVRWLLLAFLFGSAFAGIAGVIFAGIQRFVSPSSFVLEESIFVLSIVVLAGGRSLWRLVLAAGILSFLPEVLRGLADYRMLIYGILLSVFVVVEERLKALAEVRRSRKRITAMTPVHLDSMRHIPGVLLSERSQTDWVLAVSHLSMRFGGVAAVDDLSFSVQLRRSIVGLIGPNGAGKTTLFNCISGQYQLASGTITFPDMRKPHTPNSSALAGVGRTFQTPRLFHSMTVRENIAAGAMACRNGRLPDRLALHMASKTSDRLAPGIVDGILEYLGLAPIGDMNVKSLPLGIQRLVELGRALALRPNVILVDEIASGLNSRDKQYMASLIRNLSQEAGIGFLIVEHDMSFVLPLAKEVLVLDAGKLIDHGLPDKVTRNPAVIDAYLGKADDFS